MSNSGDIICKIPTAELHIPELTKRMIDQLNSVAEKAYSDDISKDEIEKAIESINPLVASIVKSQKGLTAAGALILMLTLSKCSIEIKLDANELFSQIQNISTSKIPMDKCQATSSTKTTNNTTSPKKT